MYENTERCPGKTGLFGDSSRVLKLLPNCGGWAGLGPSLMDEYLYFVIFRTTQDLMQTHLWDHVLIGEGARNITMIHWSLRPH